MSKRLRTLGLGTCAAALGLFAAPIPAQAGEEVTYQAAGADYQGYFAPASGEAKGLVLVIHDWDGMTDYEEKRADMLAELGYDAFALDLFGAGNRPDTVEARRAATSALYQDREAMRTRLMAGLEAARGQSQADQTVVMGYCFGGAATLELARSGEAADIAGYASFHGGLATPEGQSYPDDTPPILIEHGGADTSVTLDEAMGLASTLEEAGLTYRLDIHSGAPHAFTVFGSDRYRERADMASWETFKGFLDDQLG